VLQTKTARSDWQRAVRIDHLSFSFAAGSSRGTSFFVIAGHSRSKNGVASLAYDPAIHRAKRFFRKMDARVKPAHDASDVAWFQFASARRSIALTMTFVPTLTRE
jgi:hypothetical protein